ncbi:MAG TPA: DUF3987 domain-containing protein, partial [Prolixibacteraceae bacterium]|nr:DUF3987 domain-containing protein [Prolixibacteraceae bacterium]
MHDTFNPLDWIEPDQSNSEDQPSNPSTIQSFSHPTIPSSDISSEVDTVISRIEANLTDITTSYPDWLNVGFAFANQFGEGGRGFFHRVSRFYSGYTKAECDKQYDHCLKSTPSSRCITIKTFFHLAQQAGIVISGQSQWSDSASYDRCPNPSVVSGQSPLNTETDHCLLPTLPDSLFYSLPGFLQRVVEKSESREERDGLLLGSLTTLSSCLHKVYGIYHRRKVRSNLFLFITAQASAGKGNLVLCKLLVRLVHWKKREEDRTLKQRYVVDMNEYNLLKGKDLTLEKPEKPPEKLLFIPANSSSTGVFQLLADNEGQGLIFETEGDTMAQSFKSDYGNYSDGFRKAFHHESISYYRRTDREYVEIDQPCLSAMLSATLQQLFCLIPSAENGLFSRFMFYFMNMKTKWQDVFSTGDSQAMEEHFNALGQEFMSLYTTLGEGPEIQFCLTPEQKEEFNAFFSQVQEKYLLLQGIDYIATIRRLGLIAFRISMILTTLRILETGDFPEKMVCRDEDFHSTLSMIRVLVRHASYIYSALPE